MVSRASLRRKGPRSGLSREESGGNRAAVGLSVEASSSRWGRAWIGKEKERVVSSLEEMGAGD